VLVLTNPVYVIGVFWAVMCMIGPRNCCMLCKMRHIVKVCTSCTRHSKWPTRCVVMISMSWTAPGWPTSTSSVKTTVIYDIFNKYNVVNTRKLTSLFCLSLSISVSAAEYCPPVWSRSAHTSRVDVQLNSTMRLISGTLHSAPLPWLPVLSSIESPALQRKAATDKLMEKNVKHDSWPIQPDILNPALLRLTSRKPL